MIDALRQCGVWENNRCDICSLFVSNNGNMDCFKRILQIVIGNDFLYLPCLALGNQNCNHSMTAYRSNGFDIVDLLNIADHDRTDFVEVFHTDEFYSRDYIKEWW